MWPKWLTLSFWKDRWADFMEYMEDLPIIVLKAFLEGVLSVLSAIPAPQFLSTHQLGDVLSEAMPYIGYFLANAGVGQAASLVSTAVVFRIVRKAVTLGRW